MKIIAFHVSGLATWLALICIQFNPLARSTAYFVFRGFVLLADTAGVTLTLRTMHLQATAQAVEENATGTEQKKLWGGRFTGATDPLMEKFNESLPFDKRMWREDLLVSRHSMLHHF